MKWKNAHLSDRAVNTFETSEHRRQHVEVDMNLTNNSDCCATYERISVNAQKRTCVYETVWTVRQMYRWQLLTIHAVVEADVVEACSRIDLFVPVAWIR